MAANGIVLIIRFILNGVFSRPVVSSSSTELAIGASLAIVGIPLWFLHWRIVQKHVHEMAVETRSLSRKIYIYLTLAVAAVLFVISAVNILEWIMRVDNGFSGYHWGAVIVWSAVWYFYWRLESQEGQPSRDTLGVRRLYLYLGSLGALVMVAIGAGRIVQFILFAGYDALFSTSLVASSGTGIWRPAMGTMIAILLVGGAVWATHWLWFARRDYGSALRQVYLYIFAILGGVVTGLVGLGMIVNGVLSWLLGVPMNESLANYFRFMPGAIATLSVGFGLWAYHWSVVKVEAEASMEESQGAQRFYAYVLTLIGLIGLGIGIGIASNTAFAILTESSRAIVAGRDLWRAPFAMAITLAILGGPIWFYYWNMAQKRMTEIGSDERRCLTRRMFTFIVLGIGVLALLGSVSTLLFVFLRDLLDLGLSLQTARDARTPLSFIIAVVIFLPYYWKIYQKDREADDAEGVTAERRVRKDVSVLVNSGGESFVRSLEGALGYRVTTLRWADPDASLPALSEGDSQTLAQQVSETHGNRVLLIPNGTGVRVLSYN
jgi:hypothetical protein